MVAQSDFGVARVERPDERDVVRIRRLQPSRTSTLADLTAIVADPRRVPADAVDDRWRT